MLARPQLLIKFQSGTPAVQATTLRGTEAKTGWGVQSFCSGFAHPKHLLAKEEIEKFREAFKRTGEEPVPWVAHGSTYPCQSHWKGKLKQQAEPP